MHAGWNALAKRARDPLVFLWSSVTLASLALAPLGVWVVVVEGWKPGGAWFVLATVAVHALYFWVLARAYASGDLSIVYPVARGLGVALVPLLAFAFLDERLSRVGVLGITLVIGGIVFTLAPSQAEKRAVRGSPAGPTVMWSIATGMTIATYSVIDKAGVARVHPLAYISVMGFGISVLLAPWVLRRRERLVGEWRANGRAIVLASSMNLTSYLLVLFAFRLAKAGYVVAVRETSIVFSVLIGSLIMREGSVGTRLAGALVVLIGVGCVVLAR
jgi:drug/metabolite transporter (DMT)-like permease